MAVSSRPRSEARDRRLQVASPSGSGAGTGVIVTVSATSAGGARSARTRAEGDRDATDHTSNGSHRGGSGRTMLENPILRYPGPRVPSGGSFAGSCVNARENARRSHMAQGGGLGPPTRAARGETWSKNVPILVRPTG